MGCWRYEEEAPFAVTGLALRGTCTCTALASPQLQGLWMGLAVNLGLEGGRHCEGSPASPTYLIGWGSAPSQATCSRCEERGEKAVLV